MNHANRETSSVRQCVAIVTGTRAEFGLLRSVMRAVSEHAALDLCVMVSGMHLVAVDGDEPTFREIEREFDVAATVPMQDGESSSGRAADVQALGRGIAGFGIAFARWSPDVVVVLGDRIEAFAAASAASVGGRLLAHIHGGDRAEGVADEAMRHAISKLAHIHFPATPDSAARLIRMGEDPAQVHVVGSPAMDELSSCSALSDGDLSGLGLQGDRPFAVVFHHPCGLDEPVEQDTMSAILTALESDGADMQYVLLSPNHDPGRAAVMRAIGGRHVIGHLERRRFVGLLRRCAVLIGNSSCGLIEAAALGVPVVNVGPRQHGRLRCSNVIDVDGAGAELVSGIRSAVRRAQRLSGPFEHPYGDGRSGQRIAGLLAAILRDNRPSIRKCNAY